MERSMSKAARVPVSSSGVSRVAFIVLAMVEDSSRRVQPVVTLFLQFESEVDIAGLDEAAVGEDVNDVGLDVIGEALVVGDEKNAAVRAAHEVHTFRDDLQGVDVEAGIGFIEH